MLASLQELEAGVIAALPKARVSDHAVSIAQLAKSDGGQIVGCLLALASVVELVARLMHSWASHHRVFRLLHLLGTQLAAAFFLLEIASIATLRIVGFLLLLVLRLNELVEHLFLHIIDNFGHTRFSLQ